MCRSLLSDWLSLERWTLDAGPPWLLAEKTTASRGGQSYGLPFYNNEQKCIFIEVADGCSASLPYLVFFENARESGKKDLELVMAAMVSKNKSLSHIFHTLHTIAKKVFH